MPKLAAVKISSGDINSPLSTYEFDIVISGIDEIADDQADALFAAGCDDATPISSNGLAWIHFDREASSLEDAIRSAVAQVRRTGLQVAKTEMDAGSAVFQGS